MQDLHEAWGERMRERRQDSGLKLSELAELCGVSESTLSRVELGKLPPNDDLKWKIAGALSIRMDRLWAWPTVVPPHPSTVKAVMAS